MQNGNVGIIITEVVSQFQIFLKEFHRTTVGYGVETNQHRGIHSSDKQIFVGNYRFIKTQLHLHITPGFVCKGKNYIFHLTEFFYGFGLLQHSLRSKRERMPKQFFIQNFVMFAKIIHFLNPFSFHRLIATSLPADHFSNQCNNFYLQLSIQSQFRYLYH